jgi:formylglycine-generating enzyme
MTTNRLVALAFVVLVCTAAARSAAGDTFGSGANTFDIEFVTIGNPGNAADTTGEPNPAGSVPYTYRMGKFEVSEQMIDEANAEGGLGITKETRGPNKPATFVNWNEAARFVNWLNTSTGSPPAYKFAIQPGEVGYIANANIELWTISDAGYDPNNLFRNTLARYFLPDVHEWYKAAYYDPTSGIYFHYPTGSDSAPTPVASGTAAGTAVYNNQPGLADISFAGGLSPYGTMGQGGNIYEWEETDFDLVNDSSSSARGIRGGFWGEFSSLNLSSSSRLGGNLTDVLNIVGFRVASIAIPEPSTLLLGVLAGLGLLGVSLPPRRLRML